MNHLRSVQTRNVVVSNVMMSNAPKMTCPGDPRAQTHTNRQGIPERGAGESKLGRGGEITN